MVYSACRWVQARLPLLAGDDLIGPDRRRAERHLVGCPDCRRHLDALRATVQTLRTAAEVPAVTPGTAAPLWPDLARQIRESRRAAAFPWLRLLTSPSFALAATLLLTVTGGLVAGLLQDRQEAGSTVASRAEPDTSRPLLLTEKPAKDPDLYEGEDGPPAAYADRSHTGRDRAYRGDGDLLPVEDTR